MYLLFSLSVIQAITAILDSASNDLLSECHRRSLKKIASLPDSNEEIDDTILTWWSRTELILNNLCRSPLYNPRHTHHTCPCCLSWTKAEMGCVFSHIFPTFFFSFSLCIIVLAAFKPNFYFFFFLILSHQDAGYSPVNCIRPIQFWCFSVLLLILSKWFQAFKMPL